MTTISFLGYDLGSPEPNKGTQFRSKLIMLVVPGACERLRRNFLRPNRQVQLFSSEGKTLNKKLCSGQKAYPNQSANQKHGRRIDGTRVQKQVCPCG